MSPDDPGAARPQTRHPSFAALAGEFTELQVAELAEAAADWPIERLRDEVDSRLDAFLRDGRLELSRAERSQLIQGVIHELHGAGPIEPLLADPEVWAIHVRGPDRVYEQRGSSRQLTDLSFRDEQHLRRCVTRLAASAGQVLDEDHPILDSRIRSGVAAGSRLHVVLSPPAYPGTCVTIRKFGKKLSTAELVNFGTLSRELADLLAACVEARLNILVIGRERAGATTLLNALCSYLGSEREIVTVEEAPELQLRQERVVRFDLLPLAPRSAAAPSLRELLVGAARLVPGVIVLGECRGDETIELCRHLRDGAFQGLATCHADSARDALYRLEDLLLAAEPRLTTALARELLCQAFDLIVEVCRQRDGRRVVDDVAGVFGLSGETIVMQTLFCFDATWNQTVSTGLRPPWFHELQQTEHGASLPADIFTAKERPDYRR